jgi:hypothetical protein
MGYGVGRDIDSMPVPSLKSVKQQTARCIVNRSGANSIPSLEYKNYNSTASQGRSGSVSGQCLSRFYDLSTL